jgi:hypothetical protein
MLDLPGVASHEPGQSRDSDRSSRADEDSLMLDWILNPYGIDLGAYVVLWIALLVTVPVAIVVGIVKAVRSGRGNGRS